MEFDRHRPAELCHLVATSSARPGVLPRRVHDLAVAVNQAATSGITHGDGHRIARIGRDGHAFVCEIGDAGVIIDPSSGNGSIVSRRMRPAGATR